MATRTGIAIAPHRFAFGFYRQTWWNWLIGTAFFCGGLGGGLFLVSLLTREPLGMLIGYLIVVLGKNSAHLAYLGRPLRFWRAAMRPDRSWIARGIWATGLFAIFGFLAFAPHFFAASWPLPAWVAAMASWVAGLAALFIMFYDGLLMSSSPGVAFWNTGLLPVLILMYATLGGTTLSLTLRGLFGMGEEFAGALGQVEKFLLVANFLLLCVYLLRMRRKNPAARETAAMLLRGPYAWAFVGLVLAVGLGATLLFSLAESQVQAEWMLVVMAGCELLGDFSLFIVLLRSGLFSPQTAPAYEAT